MDELIYTAIAAIITYAIGLLQKSPIYDKFKVVKKALEDGKITVAEAKEIKELFEKSIK